MDSQEHDVITLSIHFSAYGFGYAIFENVTKPIDWRLVRLKYPKKRMALDRVRELIEFYQPSFVLIDTPKSKRRPKSRQVKQLIKEIECLATTYNIPTLCFSPGDIERVFGAFGAHTKYERAKQIAQWLPSVSPRLPKARQWWIREDYRLGIFEAIALAITFYYQYYEEQPHEPIT
ncbi:MAG: hypothetical protein AAF434_01625 [Pseudomonadota bacterium]